MTFSQSVKTEVLKSIKNIKPCCAQAFLSAVLKSVGSLELSLGGFTFSVDSENKQLLQLCGEISNVFYNAPYTIQKSSVSAKGNDVFTVRFDSSLGEKLGFAVNGVLQTDRMYLPKYDCCRRTFLQGLFVAAGNVVVPILKNDLSENTNSSRYHLEIRFADKDFCMAVKAVYDQIAFHYLERKSHHILYLKGSEQIADFFVAIGAMSAKLKLENIIVGRSVRNTANRQSNCISANLDKSVLASGKQLDAIAKLKENGKFSSLPQGLVQIAEMREDFPEATIDELAQKLGISKSGASHRLSKLVELASD